MNPYKVLDIPEGADESKIKTAFREKAKIHHPDVSNNNDDSEFKLILEAYEILRNNNWKWNIKTSVEKIDIDELFNQFIKKYPTYRAFFNDDIIKAQLKWSSLRNRP